MCCRAWEEPARATQWEQGCILHGSLLGGGEGGGGTWFEPLTGSESDALLGHRVPMRDSLWLPLFI